MRFLFLSILFLNFSCGDKGTTPDIYSAKPEDFQKFVNDRALSEPDLAKDKTIINVEYPIEIALYKDGQFYYNLPKLGDGTGTWEFDDGHLHLKAKRKLFDMRIDVFGRDEKTENLVIRFVDRFGLNTLVVEKENME
jgi:hypothetical protein